MARKILFIDRDGTLIKEPADEQIDRLDKFELVEDVIPALRRFQDAGYVLVMITNQDGLGTDTYPQADFDRVQDFLIAVFKSQGITFEAVRICPHVEADGCECRKPRVGLVLDYLRDGFDAERSAVIGDRTSDLKLADALGVQGFKLAGFEGDGDTWLAIAHQLIDAPRRATVSRKTRETSITASVDLDDGSVQSIHTGIGFFDHMLTALSRHGGFSLDLQCDGDTWIDDHHSVEDCALVIGEALNQALGDRRGITRFAFTLPMDDTQATAAIDLGGRPWFEFDGRFNRDAVGELSTEMVPHFFRSLAETLRMNLHLKVAGDNAHHQVEACFKATARALRQALARDGSTAMPSTKGSL